MTENGWLERVCHCSSQAMPNTLQYLLGTQRKLGPVTTNSNLSGIGNYRESQMGNEHVNTLFTWGHDFYICWSLAKRTEFPWQVNYLFLAMLTWIHCVYMGETVWALPKTLFQFSCCHATKPPTFGEQTCEGKFCFWKKKNLAMLWNTRKRFGRVRDFITALNLAADSIISGKNVFPHFVFPQSREPECRVPFDIFAKLLFGKTKSSKEEVAAKRMCGPRFVFAKTQ